MEEGLKRSYEVEQKEELGDPEEEKKALKRKEEAKRRAAMSDSERKKVSSRVGEVVRVGGRGELIDVGVLLRARTARAQGTEEATTKGSVEAAQGGQVRAIGTGGPYRELLCRRACWTR